MSFEFKLPELGENIVKGDVVKILVHQGQAIAANQSVLELETDKAVVELPCASAGTVVKILVKAGDTVKVGQALLLLDGVESPAAKPPEKVAQPPSAVPGGSSMRVADNAGQASSATPAEPAQPRAAVLQEAAVVDAVSDGPLPAGPAARRLARELGVDLRHVRGSGDDGRITPEDVQAAKAATGKPRAAVAPAEAVVPPGEPGQDAWGPVLREKMSAIRRTIAAQMSKSATVIPHVTNFDDADVTELEQIRKNVPPGYLGPDVKLTAMPLVMKAVALSLRRHPRLNASVEEAREEEKAPAQIVYKQYVNLGVAVDTPRGLVVPVMRNVDQMTVPEIARALAVMSQRARQAQFAIEDLRGGTFTLSNLGAVGGTYSTPIINYPEVAVLLLGRSRWLPTVEEGKIEPRLKMPLSLSYDHRVVDGAAAARFLNDVIDYLQTPGKLLLAEA